MHENKYQIVIKLHILVGRHLHVLLIKGTLNVSNLKITNQLKIRIFLLMIYLGKEDLGCNEFACEAITHLRTTKIRLSCEFYECRDETALCNQSPNVPMGKFELNANGTACVDINECERGLAKCDQNANCTNTFGSYLCECKSNYEGDGTFCSEIIPELPKVDWCSEKFYCGENASCENIQTKAICKCKKGYLGDPYKGCKILDSSKQLVYNTTVKMAFDFLEGLKYNYADLHDNFRTDVGFAINFLFANLPEYIQNSLIVENPRYPV